MLRPYGPGLSSDAIAHRHGFDGSEPREVLHICKTHAALGVRSTFAINTFYQEVASGYYINQALLALIDRAWRSLHLLPITWDNYRESGLVPVEGEGQLLVGDNYVLATHNQSLAGFIQVWQANIGNTTYYADNIILDLILPESITERLVSEVESQCLAASVRFKRTSTVDAGRHLVHP